KVEAWLLASLRELSPLSSTPWRRPERNSFATASGDDDLARPPRGKHFSVILWRLPIDRQRSLRRTPAFPRMTCMTRQDCQRDRHRHVGNHCDPEGRGGSRIFRQNHSRRRELLSVCGL